MTGLNPILAVEQVDEMVLTCEREEDYLGPLNHSPERTILSQTGDVDFITRVSTVRVELSFEDKEEDDAFAKCIADMCCCTQSKEITML